MKVSRGFCTSCDIFCYTEKGGFTLSVLSVDEVLSYGFYRTRLKFELTSGSDSRHFGCSEPLSEEKWSEVCKYKRKSPLICESPLCFITKHGIQHPLCIKELKDIRFCWKLALKLVCLLFADRRNPNTSRLSKWALRDSKGASREGFPSQVKSSSSSHR